MCIVSFSFFRQWLRPKRLAEDAAQNPAAPVEAEVQFRLGLKFAAGEGETQDYPQAAECYLTAAAQDHPLAQFNLAVMYAQGQGVARDEERALGWLTRAAELGDAGAQYKLGVQRHLTCRNAAAGTVSETRIEALKWVRLSAAQGYRGADRACEFVTLEMTRDEFAEGERRVAAFVAGKRVGAQSDVPPGK